MSDLAKRAVACKHWRWMPGSAFDTGLRYDGFARPHRPCHARLCAGAGAGGVARRDDRDRSDTRGGRATRLGDRGLGSTVTGQWDRTLLHRSRSPDCCVGGCTMKYGKKPVNDSSA